MIVNHVWYFRFQDEPGRFPNSRGFSCLFGPDVTAKFLADNKLLYIVRSHECVQYGYDLTHDDQVGAHAPQSQKCSL